MSEKKKVRIGLGTFDLIKGIAILSVVVGHALQGHPGGETLTSTVWGCYIASLGWGLMPMFFIINGYCFKEKSPILMLKKTFSELLAPYLISIPIATVLHVLFFWNLYPDMMSRLIDIEKRFSAFVLGTDSAGPLWFFLAMFIANNILNLIFIRKSEWMRVLLVALCVILSFVVMHCDFRYFRIIEGLSAVGFCYVGYILKKKKMFEWMPYSIWSYFLFIPMWLLQFLGMRNGGAGFDMAVADYSIPAYFFAGCTGVLIICFGLLLNQFEWNLLDAIRKCGMYSYWILIVHTVDYLAIPWWDLWARNPNTLFAAIIELGLRCVIFVLGFQIMKKVTHFNYKNKKIMAVGTR